ncbi:O-antigen/teichoic acid export membrane protein [Luteibacter sp. Sphag1AF]|uniref:hypothetical protein n=1 Tax=Luteibacter sp. Sphag1AF TaxID=2587031 RepID=UPI00160A706E|nr:hypothetical protein [Luteibacter sp. Sphag1AF]MBB3226678.1 O-antigen/teichoic acid export membrane protein [Luteibacter sp. Sphag1AF]
MNLLACAMAFVAVTLVYLTLPTQRLRQKPLSRAWRVAGAALTVLAVAFWAAEERGLPGFFATLSAAMLAAVALPYLVWWIRPAASRERRRA